VRSRGILIRR